MKVFSTKFHGYLDYLVGVVLLAMPALLDLDNANIESQVFFATGGILLFYSLLTKYELGLVRVIPMKVHLVLDVLSGLFLAASPWILGFGERIFIPYLVLGVAEMIAGLTTTSKRGQPEMQEIIATEPINLEIIRESSMNARATATRTSRNKPVKQRPVSKPAAETKEPVKHSVTETKKAAEAKKTITVENKKSATAAKKAPAKKPAAASKSTARQTAAKK